MAEREDPSPELAPRACLGRQHTPFSLPAAPPPGALRDVTRSSLAPQGSWQGGGTAGVWPGFPLSRLPLLLSSRSGLWLDSKNKHGARMACGETQCLRIWVSGGVGGLLGMRVPERRADLEVPGLASPLSPGSQEDTPSPIPLRGPKTPPVASPTSQYTATPAAGEPLTSNPPKLCGSEAGVQSREKNLALRRSWLKQALTKALVIHSDPGCVQS